MTRINAKTPPPDTTRTHTDLGKNQSTNQRLNTRTLTAQLLTAEAATRVHDAVRLHHAAATARLPTPPQPPECHRPPPDAIPPPDDIPPPPPTSPVAILLSQDALTPPHHLPLSPNARQVGAGRRLKQPARGPTPGRKTSPAAASYSTPARYLNTQIISLQIHINAI
jgi:hypothetical protein